MRKTIHVGYEVGTGKSIEIPLLNLAITGQTQSAGKTTALEALASRCDARVLTFVTKRGEKAFAAGARVQPYFRDRADWQFVMGLIEAMMQEKNRFLRQYIIPICRTTRTLKDVQREVRKKKTAIYVEIDAYLDLILPQIDRAKLADALILKPGLNVIDLSAFPTPMQMLFVQSAIDWINEHEHDTVVVIPEAWEFCLSDDTEVLTKAGWKRGIDLTEGELVACFDKDSEHSSYQSVQRVIVRRHDGPMAILSGKWADCLCTPDHRVLLKDFDHASGVALPDWRFTPASDVHSLFVIPTPRPIAEDGIPELDNKTLRILGWLITDGWWHKKWRYFALEQSVTTKKLGRYIAEVMREVLESVGAKTSRRSRGGTVQIDKRYAPCLRADSLVFYLGTKLSASLRPWLGTDHHRIPRRLLEEGSSAQLRELFNGLMEGDGTTKRGVWSSFYPGLNEPLADDFQELCTRLGIRSVKSRIAGQWRISLSDRRDCWVRRKPLTQYSGVVWDITVPTGAFIARRNGKVFVTGNCPEGKGSPVKPSAIALVRKGSSLGNRIWIDSQDMAGVDKTILRGCPVWLIGVQREINEIKRNIANIPTAKPKPTDVALLGLGQFFVCHGATVVKTYVQPAWMSADEAEHAAMRTSQGPSGTDEPRETHRAPAPEARATVPGDASGLKSGERAMLDRLVQAYPVPVPPKLWGAACARSPVSGPWHVAVRNLKAAGLIEDTPSGYLPTQEGIAASTDFSRDARDQISLFAMWRAEIAASVGDTPMQLLRVLADHRTFALTPEQWGLLAKRSSKSGPWHVAVKALREWDLISDGSPVRITDTGLALFIPLGSPHDGTRELIRVARSDLLSASAARLYDVISLCSSPVTKQELADKLGLSSKSGPWHSSMKELRESGLVEEAAGKLHTIEEALVRC